MIVATKWMKMEMVVKHAVLRCTVHTLCGRQQSVSFPTPLAGNTDTLHGPSQVALSESQRQAALCGGNALDLTSFLRDRSGLIRRLARLIEPDYRCVIKGFGGHVMFTRECWISFNKQRSVESYCLRIRIIYPH